MHKNTLIKLIALPLALFLIACGEGSETSPPNTSINPSSPKLSLTANSEVKVNENSSAEALISINYNGNEQLKATMEPSSIESLSTDLIFSGNTLKVIAKVGEMSGMIAEYDTLNITVTAGHLSQSVEVPAFAFNISYEDEIKYIEREHGQIRTFAVSKELENISTYLADKAYLYGMLTYDEKEEWLRYQNTNAQMIEQEVRGYVLLALEDILENHKDMTEIEAVDAYNKAMSAFYASYESFMPLLVSYQDLSVPNFTTPSSLAISNTYNGYSLFYGNRDIGSFNNEQWRFHSDYEILALLLPTNSALCIASK